MKAYPFSHRHPTTGVTTSSEGMDLRDYFAGLVLQGFTSLSIKTTDDELARESYKMADAMMKARSKQDE